MNDSATFAGTSPEAAALAVAPFNVMVFDGQGQTRFVSREAVRQLGLPPGTDLAGRPMLEVARLCAFRGSLGPGDPEALAQQLMAVDRSKPHRRVVRGNDGRWLEMTSEPLPDGGFASYAYDITHHHQARANLTEDMRRLEMALQQQPGGVGVFDAEKRLLLHNDAYERVLGMIPGTLHRGTSLADVQANVLGQYGMDPAIREANAERSQIDRSRPHDEVRTLPDGRTIRTTSLPMASGGFLVTVEDVTALRRAEEEAQLRFATLRGVLAALPYGICVYDSSQRLTMVNDAYQRILKGAELQVGEYLLDICRRREAAGEYPPGITAEDIYQRQFRRDQPPRTRRRHDGTMIEVRNAPLPDGGHINVVADVTALHQAEAKAKQRADLLQAMLDNMRHGVCLFDRESRVVALNGLARQLNGLEPEECLPGTTLTEIRELQRLRGEYREGHMAAYYACMAPPDKRSSYIHQRLDGVVVEVSTDPTPDGGFVRTYADVTEERRIRRALEEARRTAEDASSAKTRFLATMSHELRTPLNAVIGFSEALLAEDGMPPSGMEFSAAILDAGRHLLSLIDDILQVSQLGSGGMAAQTRALFLPSVLDSAQRLMRGAADQAGVAFVVEPLPQHLPRAQADERRLRQILLNLLSNAVKFTPSGGTVRLAATSLPDGQVDITVTDTGIGIAAEDLPRAFEPFVQLETTHDRRYGGSGLGLYLARAFARTMGAELTLESTRGAGTTARLRLAAARTPAQEQTA
ncbi:PAS-domain containing protein [Roseomonas aerophila]|uniref:histidine kinase n=1 Tax=Teichococcus aerophilus TaxID=1224513 RepID=A0ABR7RSW0_9PROT|nr:PAS-domain containing protein [Pseudoroseomonas aerophila]MBC9209230.1 PAS-domain containing protein [Pseudoroseomonas aerophila]